MHHKLLLNRSETHNKFNHIIYVLILSDVNCSFVVFIKVFANCESIKITSTRLFAMFKIITVQFHFNKHANSHLLHGGEKRKLISKWNRHWLVLLNFFYRVNYEYRLPTKIEAFIIIIQVWVVYLKKKIAIEVIRIDHPNAAINTCCNLIIMCFLQFGRQKLLLVNYK